MATQDQEFAQRIDIVALVSEYVTLRRHGREYQGLCPFHSERTPSFSVNPEKGFWYCHGCHEGGDAISFLAKVEGVGRGHAMRLIAERQGLSRAVGEAREADDEKKERLYAACSAAARYYAQQLSLDEALVARNYLRSRGVDKSCAATFGLGYAPAAIDSLYHHLANAGFTLEEMEEAGLCTRGESPPELGARGESPPELGARGQARDRMWHRLIIPVADSRGRVIAFGGRALGDASPKYLNSPDSALFHKSRTLYLLHRARRAIQAQNYVVLVEGYLDALMAHHYGVENVVATLGTAVTTQHAQTLRRLTGRVVMALDADEAGQRAVEKAAPLFSDAGMEVSVASLPAGMDPDVFLRTYGPDRFRETIDGAVGAVEYRLGMALRGADLNTDEGKKGVLQECTRILAGVSSPLLRDKYVDDLARLWVGAQATGETLLDNIDMVRDEVARQVRSSMGGRRRSVAHRLAEGPAGPGRLENEEARAEEQLLAALMAAPTLLDRCAADLAPSELRVPAHREIYERLLTMGPVEEWLTSLEEESIVGAAARLLAAAETIMNPEGTLTDCLARVKDFDRRVRFDALRARFAQMASGAGETITAEEIAEYNQLIRHFKAGTLDSAA